jgi:hypothetical protein
MSRFQPEEYKPDGGFSVMGLPILLLVLCLAGVGLGWLASFIGQWFYLIVVFPLAIGVGLVIVGMIVGHQTKMRSTGMALLVGLICSVVAVSAMHYFDYLRFLPARQEILKAAPLLDNLPPGPQDAQTKEVLQSLKEVQGADSFAGFLNMEATRGVTLARGKAGINLGYIGTWIYWFVELIVVAFMTTVGLIAGAAAPFCSACNSWKEERQLGTLRKKGVDVAAYLKDGELGPLSEHEPAQAGGDLILSAAVCPNCKSQSPISFKLHEETTNTKGEKDKKELLHLTYPGAALAEFEALFVNAPASSAKKSPPVSFEGLGG